MAEKEVNWSKYAKEYDIMATYNPAYQELLNKTRSAFSEMHLPQVCAITDIGSGTGNFPLQAVLPVYPKAKYFLIDYDPGMVGILQQKVSDLKKTGPFDIEVMQGDVLDLTTLPNDVDAVSLIHTLYVLGNEQTGNPQKALKNIHSTLKDDGIFYIADIGRELKVMDWAKYLLVNGCKNIGIIETAKRFLQTPQVRKQNQNIQRMQKTGQYFMHDVETLERLIREAGFGEILEKSSSFYRGIDDLIIARK